jgi:hypothetical protein
LGLFISTINDLLSIFGELGMAEMINVSNETLDEKIN